MAQAMKGKQGSNQSEGEFFALEKTGRDGVQSMLSTMRGEIVGAAAAQVQRQPDAWLKRAFLSVVNNDNLKEVIGHKRGIYSIYKCFLTAAQMGLQLGGQFPHAHLVPFGNKDNGYAKEAQLVPTAEGFRFACVHGPQPVLRDAIFRPVYEADEVAIDQGKGEVSHRVNPGVERGKLLGVYGKLERADGATVVEWVPISEIEAVRDNHSLAWQKGWKSGWNTDAEAMCIKTAAKRILKPYAAESEGLSMLFSADESMEPAPEPPREVGERTAGVLDGRLSAMEEPPEVRPESEPEADPEPESKQESKQAAPAQGDIF